ncbi:DUF2789 domain-containing protein [Pelomonas sp. SE-A7]|uniref:DUF2789 domain-containing protein n=1 Tax=Pelomonas sp. SE-A7 TaxID=3054953 RepID=UPI00259C7C40|nr:DUF2789 domain-containing protein [Pelomonas sp. SE-A7]MDM4768285.1 DUF2789 domain-containing protein [Pelomonas sp. SE-A7]
MDKPFHKFSELFKQLGLPTDEAGIAAFLQNHAPLAAHIPLAEAPFWNPSQASLLKDELLEDADWAEVVDQLNAALRKPNSRG